MLQYRTVKDKAEEWNLSPRHVQYLCRNGGIDGAIKRAEVWFIPADTVSPAKNTKLNCGNFCFVGTKKRIFHTAIQLFMEKGYDNVSLRDIAAKVGIRQSTIYNHFRSKQEILNTIYAFFRHYYLKDRPALEEMALLIQTKSVGEMMEALRYNFHEDYVEQIYSIIKIIFQRLPVDSAAGDIAKTLMLQEGIQYVDDVFQMAIRSGRFAPFDTRAFAVFVNSARVFTLYNWIVDPSPESMAATLADEDSLNQFVPCFMNAFASYSPAMAEVATT